MVGETLFELIYHGREERNLEYKRSMSWAEPATKAKLAKSAMAMANLPDGGSVVIGVEKQGENYDPKGMEPADVESFRQDDVMEYINVLLTTQIGDECLRLITAISPKIRSWDVSWMILEERKGNASIKEQFDVLLAQAEVIYGFMIPQNLIARAPDLKWIQTMTAGIDHLTPDILQSPIMVTNAGGLHSTAISEFAIHLMLMFAKQAPLCFRLKEARLWERYNPSMLRGKTLGLLGLGKIGREVARLAKAFRMKVIALDSNPLIRSRYLDSLLSPAQLHELLAESDFVVVALPLTTSTNKLVGEAELRSMKSTAYLINIARGKILDEEALTRALSEHWIAGAGLDAFATEPLPANSQLWLLPNVILSPHVAGTTEDYYAEVTRLFSKNLRRYLHGEGLLNVVDKNKGY